jgi:seryl-tRNA synthetase
MLGVKCRRPKNASPCPPDGHSYNPAHMLDLKYIRENLDDVLERLNARGGGDGKKLEEALALDEKRRKAITQTESLKAEVKKASKEIGALMGQKKIDEAEAKKVEVREINERIAALDRELKTHEDERNDILIRLPNPPHRSVPPGSDASDNPLVREWGEKPSFDFEPKSHVDICEDLGLVDFARAAKLSGSGFALYTKWGARLERALIQYMLDLHTSEHGYTEVSPPFMVSRDCMVGVGQLPKFSDQAYAIQEGEDTESLGQNYLIPTAEAPVANIHREEILDADALPISYCAYSPCFRAEAGAAGVNTRGLIRMHQFDKVELVKIVEPEKSYDELETMTANAEKILQSLGLHYRVVLLCRGDMGFASAKTYDIEVWAPGQGAYLEVSSVSNCEDFQARRMGLRYRAEKGTAFPHMLNGSGTALARLFVALLESYQREDGEIDIPENLRPYLNADRIPRA